MGDEILINFKLCKILFVCFTIISSLYGNSSKLSLGNETKEYDKIFEKIAETRVGISNQEIDKIKSPFIVIYKNPKDKNATKKPKITYTLDAIFDKKAKINGKWIKIYKKIGTYKLVKIKRDSVILKNTNKIKELYIRKKDESKIKFSTK